MAPAIDNSVPTVTGSPDATSTQPNSTVAQSTVPNPCCRSRLRHHRVVIVGTRARDQCERAHDGQHREQFALLHGAPSLLFLHVARLVPHPRGRGQSPVRISRIPIRSRRAPGMAQDASHGWHHGMGDGPSRLRPAHGAVPRTADGAAGVRGALPADDGGCAARTGRSSIVAIRKGQEVGGPYEANRVGVTVDVEDYEFDADGTYRLRILGRDRVALIAASRSEPYPPGRSSRSPTKAARAPTTSRRRSRPCSRYLRASGETVRPRRSAANRSRASFTLAAATPGTAPPAPGVARDARRRRAAAIDPRDLPARDGAPAVARAPAWAAPTLDVNPN